jgi:hypothetical protein
MDYKARFYDSYSTHAFTQPDSIIPDQYNPQTLNRYAYALENPIRYNDPSGHCVLCIAAIIAGIALIIAAVAVDRINTGAEKTNWATQQPTFMNEQSAYQSWQNNCYGQCHYSEALGSATGVLGGAMPETPVMDVYSEGIADIVTGTMDLVGSTVMLGQAGQLAFSSLRPASGYGGSFLRPDDEIVMFESKPGSGTIKPYDLEGNSAQSLRTAGSPEDALQAAFGRPSNPGEPYWTTTVKQIGETGRFPYLDGMGSPGHVSIYGGRSNGGEFLKIFTPHIFGDQ